MARQQAIAERVAAATEQISTGFSQTAAAAQELRKWQDQGRPPLTLAVNLSALQFRQRELPHLVAEVLHDSGIAPQELKQMNCTGSGAKACRGAELGASCRLFLQTRRRCSPARQDLRSRTRRWRNGK